MAVLAVPEARRFPSPWTVEETSACFVVRDGNGQQLAYVYFNSDGISRISEQFYTYAEERGGEYPHESGGSARDDAMLID
jgi:hypothetical protein